LSDILEKRLKLKLERLHGSRDYFHYHDEITFELVPILKITKSTQAENITDISPLHAKWVNKKVVDKDQVRLIKAFMKCIGVYGAESYIQGFSGYVVEILIAKYGTFRKLVSAATKWTPKTQIDIEKHHKNILLEVNTSKLVSPLIVIDPVQAGRNAAAGLNQENFDVFVQACRSFIKKPEASYFYKKPINKKSLSQEHKNLVYLTVKGKRGKEDVVGGKLLKVFNYIHTQLEANDFVVLDKGWEYDKKTMGVFWYSLKESKLTTTKEWEGPPIVAKEHVSMFKKKYRNAKKKGNRLFATIKRKHRRPESLLKNIMKESYVKEKVVRIEL